MLRDALAHASQTATTATGQGCRVIFDDYNDYKEMTFMTKTLSVAETKTRLSEVIREVEADGGPIVIQRRAPPALLRPQTMAPM